MQQHLSKAQLLPICLSPYDLCIDACMHTYSHSVASQHARASFLSVLRQMCSVLTSFDYNIIKGEKRCKLIIQISTTKNI